MSGHGGTGPRRVHVIDLENLAGTGHLDRDTVAACAAVYGDLGLLDPDDHVIIGCNPQVQLEVGLGWPTPHRRVVGHGPDGADLALLDVIDHERLDDRFAEVVVASGDGIFADAVADLRARGAAVTVVSRPEALAWQLYAAAGAVPVRFTGPEQDACAADDLDLDDDLDDDLRFAA